MNKHYCISSSCTTLCIRTNTNKLIYQTQRTQSETKVHLSRAQNYNVTSKRHKVQGLFVYVCILALFHDDGIQELSKIYVFRDLLGQYY